MSDDRASRPTLLLGIAALTTTAGACGIAGLFLALRGGEESLPPPGNPKGTFYDDPGLRDAGAPDAGIEYLPLPANPKGSLYDDPTLPVLVPPPLDPPQDP